MHWKSSRLSFLGSRRHLPIDCLPKDQTINAEYFSYLLVQLKDILKGKAAGSSPKGSRTCTTMPWLTGHLQPRRNCPTWASNVLITQPIIRIWPRRTTTCSLDWKKNWNVAIFRPTRRSLLPRRHLWFFFFEWLAKAKSNGLRSILGFVGNMLNKSRVWSL